MTVKTESMFGGQYNEVARVYKSLVDCVENEKFEITMCCLSIILTDMIEHVTVTINDKDNKNKQIDKFFDYLKKSTIELMRDDSAMTVKH